MWDLQNSVQYKPTFWAYVWNWWIMWGFSVYTDEVGLCPSLKRMSFIPLWIHWKVDYLSSFLRLNLHAWDLCDICCDQNLRIFVTCRVYILRPVSCQTDKMILCTQFAGLKFLILPAFVDISPLEIGSFLSHPLYKLRNMWFSPTMWIQIFIMKQTQPKAFVKKICSSVSSRRERQNSQRWMTT
jgi:hypothetical protein